MEGNSNGKPMVLMGDLRWAVVRTGLCGDWCHMVLASRVTLPGSAEGLSGRTGGLGTPKAGFVPAESEETRVLLKCRVFEVVLGFSDVEAQRMRRGKTIASQASGVVTAPAGVWPCRSRHLPDTGRRLRAQ